jgi:hypothetical protein
MSSTLRRGVAEVADRRRLGVRAVSQSLGGDAIVALGPDLPAQLDPVVEIAFLPVQRQLRLWPTPVNQGPPAPRMPAQAQGTSLRAFRPWSSGSCDDRF